VNGRPGTARPAPWGRPLVHYEDLYAHPGPFFETP